MNCRTRLAESWWPLRVVSPATGPFPRLEEHPREAGGGERRSRRRRYQVGARGVYRDEQATGMPTVIRFVLRRVIMAPEFLSVDVVRELASVG